LTALYNHYVLHTPVTFDIGATSLEERAEWLSHYADSGPHRLLVAVEDGAVVGYASTSPFGRKPAYATSVETSIYCRDDQRGRGIGTLLYSALFAAVEDEDLHRAYSGITLPNDASIGLHRRFGFTAIGVYREAGRKFDRYWDVLWMEKALR
jgi:phosphinothricin acetyltransferase